MRGLIVALVICGSTPARAGEAVEETAASPELESKHLVYVELLGKGGLYGIGYEHAIMPWLGAGAAVSFSTIRDQQTYTASPYLHLTALRGERHALFGEVGAILAHTRLASPVMNWDGVADTGGGGFASLGWEYRRRHVVLRTSGGVAIGEGGVLPMLGFAIGARP